MDLLALVRECDLSQLFHEGLKDAWMEECDCLNTFTLPVLQKKPKVCVLLKDAQNLPQRIRGMILQ